jgi:hypothetical protein
MIDRAQWNGGITMVTGPLHPEFQEELRALLNRHSLDDACSTPDFILAGMLTEHLETYRKTVSSNIQWHEPNTIGKCGQ